MLLVNERDQIKLAAAHNHIRNCPGDPTHRFLAPVPSSRNFDQTALIARGAGPPARCRGSSHRHQTGGAATPHGHRSRPASGCRQLGRMIALAGRDIPGKHLSNPAATAAFGLSLRQFGLSGIDSRLFF